MSEEFLADSSAYMVVPESVLEQHRSAWCAEDLWMLNAPTGSGDTLAASESEGEQLRTEDGAVLRIVV